MANHKTRFRPDPKRVRFSTSKFKNVRQTYNGYSYHSKMEAQYAAQLDLRIKAGEVKKWERQYKLDIRVNGHHICNYYIDFKVWMADGTIELHEVKGAETALWRLKWKLTKALLDQIEPGAKLVLIK